jgi:YidC/Oxa1 family membrane protein insertase
MNDIRRTILWVIFGFSMVLLWDQWQIFNGQKATFFPTPAPLAAQPSAQGADVPPNATTSSNGSNNSAGNGANSAPTAGVPLPVGAATNPANTISATGNIPVQDNTAQKREVVQITTDVLKVDFDTEGGNVVRVEFLKHVDVNRPGQNVVLLDNSVERIYMAQTGLISSVPGVNLPTHKTMMTARPGARVMKGNDKTLSVVFESAPQNGVQLIKTYTFKGDDYAIDVKHDIVNTSNQDVAPQLYYQLVRDGNKPAGESSFYATFTGPAIYTEAKNTKKLNLKTLRKRR